MQECQKMNPKKNGKASQYKNSESNWFVCESQALPVAENHHWHEEDRGEHHRHNANPWGNGEAEPRRLLRRCFARRCKNLH